MVAEPAATPVTTPAASTVATAPLEDAQVPPAILPEKVVVAPTQTVLVPETVGTGLTVTEAVPEQPLTVCVMVAEPAATPVTTPEEETVATAASEVDHVPPASELDKFVVAPAHTVVVPEMVGLALTVTVLVPEQPPAV
jgi:hypothetical protein